MNAGGREGTTTDCRGEKGRKTGREGREEEE